MASVRYRAAVSGQIDEYMRAEARGLGKAARAGVMAAAAAARGALKRDFKKARFAKGPERMLRRRTSPPSAGIDATSEIFSRQFTDRRDQPADVLTELSHGHTVVGSPFLFIPTRAAGQKKDWKLWDRSVIEIVRPKNGHAGWIAIRRSRLVLFWIVPDARVRKVLDLHGAMRAGESKMESASMRAWARESDRLERRF